MSGRSSTFVKTLTLATILFTSFLLLAQSQWKEIPVGYNMPKSAMAAAPAAPAPFPSTPKGANNSTYAGEGRDPNHPWEVEFHGGGFFNLGGEGGGTAKILPAGAVFTGFGGQSRAESSYMFGDGAILFNTVGTAFGFRNIAPLDPLLASQFGQRNNGPSLGMRIGRDLNQWFQIELSADWTTSAVEISDKNLLAFESTRQSVADGFTDLSNVSAGPPASAIADIRRSEGSQLFWTGVVNVNLKTSGKTVPYLTFGGGAVSRLGPTPHAAILGSYSFNNISQMDIVNIEARAPRTQGLGVLGGGIRYYATPRWGLRLDVRDHVAPNSINTLLTATPNTPPGAPPAALALSTGGSNRLTFTNDPSFGPSTLSGPTIHGLKTFRPDGITNQLSTSVGVFYRF